MSDFQPSSKPIRLFFFWSGIIATFAYRIIIFLNFYSPVWVKISWYIGTIGFILYFWHRAATQKKRADLVDKYDLVNVVDKTDCVDVEQKNALHYLIETTKTSKARFNSLFIFWLSVVALVAGVVIDVLGV